jgi:hypothetical protein
MTQQIINVGTGPDSYTGESLRTAFQKVNDNFSQLYAGNVGANISGNIITANGFVTSGNVVAGNVTAAGNISAYYFTGDGSQLTGITVSANTGNISFSNLTISGSVAGNIVLDPAGDGNVNVLSTIRTQAVRVGNVNNTEFAIDILGNTASISTAGRGNGNVSLRLAANNNGKGSITIRADDGHIGFGIPPDGYEYAFNGEVRANAYYADADFPVGYQFTTPGGDTGMTHDYQNDINGNVSLVIIKHDSVAAAKFYDNNHTILSGNLVVSQTGNVFGAAYPDAFMQAYANVNSYSQTIIQNLNSGNLASSDVVATADNGNDNSRYINMGMASSTYNVAGFDVVGPNDGYLYVAGNSYAGPFSNTSNLNIGSTTGSVRTWIGQGTAANVVTTVSPGLFTVNGTISTTGNIILPNGAVIKDNAGDSVAFGQSAGATSQGNSAVAIGHNAGVTSQGTFTVAIGRNAGQTSQGGSAVAVGVSAGDVSQGAQAVAVGNGAGGGNQGNSAVAIGVGAGQSTQGVEAVAIGNSAGSLTQGISAIAIGKGAGRYFQGNNSIIINATGADLDQTTANTFTVAPVRNDVANIGEVLFYNTTSKEITYGNTISVAGNITGGNLITTVLLVSGGITAGPIIASPAPTISGFSSISAQTLTASGNVIVGNTYVPSTTGGAGTAGQISFDENYVYVCVATNTWKRANLSTW